MRAKKYKKYLGQNFLTSPSALAKIISASGITPKDMVLEIGPGRGFLTEGLLETTARVIAVEKDADLISFLREKFKEECYKKMLHVVHEDALSFSRETHGLKEGSFVLVANIPYYITGALLRRFIGKAPRPKRAVLMLQKEVAERIVARNKKESILSIAIKIYGTPRIVARVPRGSFTPKPNVDSAILVIENIKTPFQNKNTEEKFFTIIKLGFSHKRKKLSGNLRSLWGNKTETYLEKSGIPPNERAEDVSIAQWLTLSKIS